MKTEFTTLKQFKQAYKGYFFEPKTLKLFASKIETKLYKGLYFITSEDNFEGKRVYNIRKIHKIKAGVNAIEYTIDTLGCFDHFKVLGDAKYVLQRLLRDYPSVSKSENISEINTVLKTAKII